MRGMLVLFFAAWAFMVSDAGAADAPVITNYEKYVASIRSAAFHSQFDDRLAEEKTFTNTLHEDWKIDFIGKEPLGECPISGGKVFETDTSYICEDSQTDRKPCKFKLSKTILGREISKEQAQKLLSTGKTDLLEGFISKRGRPFSAYLKFEDGKVGFEFPERTTALSESK